MNRSRSLTLRMIVMLLLVGLLFGLVFGYGAVRSYFLGKFLAGFGNQVQTVATMKAVQTAWQPTLNSVGSVVAVNGADLSAEIAGIVDTINFESGQTVPAGALLVTLRANNDPAVLAQLQATAALDRINYTRDSKQFQADAISQAQVDTDRANLAAAEAQVQGQQALIAEKQIRAPFAGTLGIRQVDLGQYLAVGTAIVSLQQLNPLFVDFYLPQQSLSDLKVGQVVTVTVDAFPGREFPAKLIALDSTVDSASRNIQLRASLPNEDLSLRPGMFARISIAIGAPRQLVTLPQTAITYNPYGDTVFVVDHGQDANGKAKLTVHQAFVAVGDTRGDQISILKGVDTGQEVVVAGQVKLRNGSPIAINNSLLPSNNPHPTAPNE